MGSPCAAIAGFRCFLAWSTCPHRSEGVRAKPGTWERIIHAWAISVNPTVVMCHITGVNIGIERATRIRSANGEGNWPLAFRSTDAWHCALVGRGLASFLTGLHVYLLQATGTVPPSMVYSVPVMDAARLETRNPTNSATSFGFAGLPRGMPPRESISDFSAAW